MGKSRSKSRPGNQVQPNASWDYWDSGNKAWLQNPDTDITVTITWQSVDQVQYCDHVLNVASSKIILSLSRLDFMA